MGQDQQDQPTEWLSTEGASRYIGVSKSTLFRLVDEGLLAAYKPGGWYKFKVRDLDAYLERVRVQPGELAHLRSDTAGRATRSKTRKGS